MSGKHSGLGDDAPGSERDWLGYPPGGSGDWDGRGPGASDEVGVPRLSTAAFVDMLCWQAALEEDEPSALELAVGTLFEDAEALLITKHRDYGPKNISDAPGGPLNGLRVRMWDKLARINNLVDNGDDPEHESLRDSFLDLLNYAAIGCLVLDGDWPA